MDPYFLAMVFGASLAQSITFAIQATQSREERQSPGIVVAELVFCWVSAGGAMGALWHVINNWMETMCGI